MMQEAGYCLTTILKQEIQVSDNVERGGKWRGLKKKINTDPYALL